MRTVLLTLGFCFLFAINVHSQTVADICGESGGVPWLNSPFVFGKVYLNGFDTATLPKITVVLYENSQRDYRYTIDRSGNYCFRRVNASGGFITVEVEAVEVARRSLPSGGPAGPVREDFEISPVNPSKPKPPSSISAKFVYARNDANQSLFKKAVEAERAEDYKKAVESLTTIVGSDPADYVAWAKICEINYLENKVADARTSCIKSIEAKPDYPPAIVNLGQILLVQSQPAEAIKFLKLATRLDASYARAFQLLGEAYALSKMADPAITALTEAIRLDPTSMAQSHLLLAALYDAKGEKQRAASEYESFLKKKPGHPDKKKFEKYIKDNANK
jgi:tetratricopeptide (TPR) repeat protein